MVGIRSARLLRNGVTGGLGVLVVALACIAGGTPVRTEAAEDLLSSQVPGFDISWPQCGKSYPFGPVAYAIIGINNGRPYTANPCFMDQYQWARRVERHPAVYINVDYPRASRIADRPNDYKDAMLPTPVYGTCAEADEWCKAYNYGYGIGREALARATSLGVTPSVWWLDVETGNYWSDDPVHNAQVVRGTLDFYRERRLATGVYSTPRQWRIIAGTFQHHVPVWTAGAQGIGEAAGRCNNPDYAFGGGAVQIVQYYDYGFDTNFTCPNGHPLSKFPLADPIGRSGPYGRSLGPSGQVLPVLRVIPMVSGK